MLEMPSLIELFRIGLMASLDLPVHLGASWRDVFVRNTEVGQVPGELGSERRAVIGLNSLNHERKMLSDFL